MRRFACSTRLSAPARPFRCTHQWPSTNYLLSWSDFIRRDSDRAVLLDSRSLSPKPATGSAFWGPPLAPHTLENVGESDLHVITVELKHA